MRTLESFAAQSPQCASEISILRLIHHLHFIHQNVCAASASIALAYTPRAELRLKKISKSHVDCGPSVRHSLHNRSTLTALHFDLANRYSVTLPESSITLTPTASSSDLLISTTQTREPKCKPGLRASNSSSILGKPWIISPVLALEHQQHQIVAPLHQPSIHNLQDSTRADTVGTVRKVTS